MTFEEFKCWLDGFSESIQVAPTREQWEKIKKVIEDIVESRPITIIRETQTVFKSVVNPNNPFPLPQIWCQSEGCSSPSEGKTPPSINQYFVGIN